jgi:hypothetical protein
MARTLDGFCIAGDGPTCARQLDKFNGDSGCQQWPESNQRGPDEYRNIFSPPLELTTISARYSSEEYHSANPEAQELKDPTTGKKSILRNPISSHLEDRFRTYLTRASGAVRPRSIFELHDTHHFQPVWFGGCSRYHG